MGRFRETSGMKRNAGRESKKAVGKVPNDILVQRMSSAASGRLKKYEPLDTRDFVPFEDYEELSVENIKEAPPGAPKINFWRDKYLSQAITKIRDYSQSTFTSHYQTILVNQIGNPNQKLICKTI